MKRRDFIGTLLALPLAAIGAIKATALLATKPFVAPKSELLVTQWFQTTRTTHVCSMAFEDALDMCMGAPSSELRANYIARRKARARRNIALLKTQRPLPLP